MSVRVNFTNWQPDKDDFGTEGLTVADNVIHDTEGYKPIRKESSFATLNFLTDTPLASVRSMQVRGIGANRNKIGAFVQDKATTATMAEMSLAAQDDGAAFTTISTSTLTSAGACKVKSFSVAELENGVFVACATFDASLTSGGFTTYALTGDITYSVT